MFIPYCKVPMHLASILPSEAFIDFSNIGLLNAKYTYSIITFIKAIIGHSSLVILWTYKKSKNEKQN